MCLGISFSEFLIDSRDAHNIYRERHGVPLLELNDGLCKYAEDHAKFLSKWGYEKSCDGAYGKNIFINTSNQTIVPDGYEPVIAWYGEAKNYIEKFGSERGHEAF